MYAHKFVPQNPTLASLIAAEHAYSVIEEKKNEDEKNTTKKSGKTNKNMKQTKKSEKSNKNEQTKKSEESEKENDTRIMVFDSDSDDNFNKQSENVCEYFDATADHNTVELCDEIVDDRAVQVDSIDSGITADEYIRCTNTAIQYEIMPGMRHTSKVLYTHDECQLYLKNSKSVVGEGWKCYYALGGCLARVHLLNGKCTFANSNQHTHARPDQLVGNLRALNEIKSILCSVNNRLKPREVFEQVVKR